MDKTQLLEILKSGDFNQLMGDFESEWLECKGEAYHFSTPKSKQEFAKDISGFANSGGGTILIGINTKKDPRYSRDKIYSLSLHKQDLVNIEQCMDILDDWIYPTPQEISIKWHQSINDKNKGITAIQIPPQSKSKWPFLVTRYSDENDKKIENVFGLFQRVKENVDHFSFQEIHGLIKKGFDYENQIKIGFENIQDALQENFENIDKKITSPTEVTTTSHFDPEKILMERLNEALNKSGLDNEPVFFLGAHPQPTNELPGLFQSSASEITQLIENPPDIRHYGFSLNTGQVSQIVAGKLRRTVLFKNRIIDLWKDGTLIFSGTGGPDYISWKSGQGETDPLFLNPMALIESTFVFAMLYEKVINLLKVNPERINFLIGFRNMTKNDEKFKLPKLTPDEKSIIFQNSKEPPSSGNEIFYQWCQSQFEKEQISFKLVSEIYEWFGYNHDEIPFTEKRDGNLILSRDKIENN